MGLAPDGPVATPQRELRPWHLWPENLPTWQLWSRLQTQWRRGGDAGRITGLDYGGVWAVLHGLRVRHPREVFEHLQAMERAVLKVVAARHAATDT